MSSQNKTSARRRGPVRAAAVASVLSLIALVPTTASADVVDDAPSAITTNLQDQAASELAYASYLASVPQITCNPRVREATGVGQTTVPSVGVLFARDAAEWNVQCASVDEPLPRYSVETILVFQSYEASSQRFEDIDITRASCTQQAVSGVANVNCLNEFTYPVNHSSLKKWHRARFRLVARDPAGNLLFAWPFFSDAWPAAVLAAT